MKGPKKKKNREGKKGGERGGKGRIAVGVRAPLIYSILPDWGGKRKEKKGEKGAIKKKKKSFNLQKLLRRKKERKQKKRGRKEPSRHLAHSLLQRRK